MASIESSGLPLVFRLGDEESDLPGGRRAAVPSSVVLRTAVRALEGMQKEAVVSIEPDGSVWRVVSDEGPYLNGTDLAPFPLAFFAAGMQFSFISAVLRSADRRGVGIDALTVRLDNRYSMEGSFLRGDALGGAVPSELTIAVESRAAPGAVAGVLAEAAARCPAQAVMRHVLTNTFALTVNGAPAALEDLPAPAGPAVRFDGSRFDALRPARVPDSAAIERLESAEAVTGVEGGAGSSLRAEQKRTLHVHGEARWTGGMRSECDIRLFKPIGSTFRFRSDETADNGGGGGAPPPLAYLSAGIGFCYMTQIGRYAHIIKQPLEGYAIVQDNVFGAAEDGTGAATAQPTETHVFVDAEDRPEIGPDIVSVGERTCFLHAAMRNELPGVVAAELNGEPLPPA